LPLELIQVLVTIRREQYRDQLRASDGAKPTRQLNRGDSPWGVASSGHIWVTNRVATRDQAAGQLRANLGNFKRGAARLSGFADPGILVANQGQHTVTSGGGGGGGGWGGWGGVGWGGGFSPSTGANLGNFSVGYQPFYIAFDGSRSGSQMQGANGVDQAGVASDEREPRATSPWQRLCSAWPLTESNIWVAKSGQQPPWTPKLPFQRRG